MSERREDVRERRKRRERTFGVARFVYTERIVSHNRYACRAGCTGRRRGSRSSGIDDDVGGVDVCGRCGGRRSQISLAPSRRVHALSADARDFLSGRRGHRASSITSGRFGTGRRGRGTGRRVRARLLVMEKLVEDVGHGERWCGLYELRARRRQGRLGLNCKALRTSRRKHREAARRVAIEG